MAIPIAPHAHSAKLCGRTSNWPGATQEWVWGDARNGVLRYMEWACGTVCSLVSNQWEGLPHAHSCIAPCPFHVAPQSFVEWARDTIAITPSQSKLSRFSLHLLFSLFYEENPCYTFEMHYSCTWPIPRKTPEVPHPDYILVDVIQLFILCFWLATRVQLSWFHDWAVLMSQSTERQMWTTGLSISCVLHSRLCWLPSSCESSIWIPIELTIVLQRARTELDWEFASLYFVANDWLTWLWLVSPNKEKDRKKENSSQQMQPELCHTRIPQNWAASK